MSRIEHVALWTHDLERLRDFYVAYFDARAGERYVNAGKGFESVFLSFDGGARLEIMRSTQLELATSPPGSQRHGLTHLAVAIGSKQGVDELTRRLAADAHRVVDGPRRTGDGYYESIVLDPDGNRIEITA